MSSAHTEHRDLDLAGITAVEVASFNGTIAIENGPTAPRLEATITAHATYNVERIGQLLYVVGKKRGPFYLGNAVSFALWLPEGLALKVANVNGAIQVRGAVGALEAATSGGTIATEATGAGDLRLTASNSLIEVRAAQGHVKAINSAGDIHLTEISGRIDATSANGALRLDRVAGQVYLTTANGATTIAHAEGQLYVQAANGGVRISDTQGQLQVSSHHNGSIHLERVTFAADSRNWIATHNGTIEALAVRAPAGMRLRAKTHQHTIQAQLPDYTVRSIRGGQGLKAQLAGEHPATLDLIGHGAIRITSQT